MVKIYTKRTCGYCHMAKQLLQSKGIEYEEIDVTGDINAFHQMVALSQGRRTVPQIFIQNEPIGGFTELSMLNRSGHLNRLTTDQAFE